MKISGFLKNSLIDYPGKISSVIFTQGCNMRCKFCHNYELLPVGSSEHVLFEESQVFGYLKQAEGFIDALVISGGEPTLQPDLEDFVKKVKNIGLLVKLDTNGTNPNLLHSLLSQQLIDYVAMDIKAPLDLLSYRQLVGHQFSEGMLDCVKNSVQLLKKSGVEYEFRTTLIRECHTKEHIRKICEQLDGATQYTMQSFSPEKVLDESFHNYTGYSISELEQCRLENSPLIGDIRIV